jgi:protein phosphatase
MAFVLCSDGNNKEMSDAELDDECRRNKQPQNLVADLFEVALSRAARDNISAVVVRLQE